MTNMPLYVSIGDILKCENYEGLIFMSEMMKLWERIIERRGF